MRGSRTRMGRSPGSSPATMAGASRFTPCTSRAIATSPGSRKCGARRRSARSTHTPGCSTSWSATTTSSRACAASSPTSRSRTCASTSRTATARVPTTPRTRTRPPAGTALARSRAEGAAPPFRGIRIKSLEAPTRHRAVRTCIAFVTSLTDAGATLDDFVVTLPKVTSVEQVEAMVHLCERAEAAADAGRLRFEIQVETPQSILSPDGAALVARMVHASAGRCTGLHYGTYDYSAFCGIAAPYQSMAHPAADHAKLVMQAAAAGTGVRLSDGSTNRLPVGDAAAVRRGWERAPATGAPLAGARLLPGLGPAPRAAADPVRGDVRLLPRRPRRRRPPPARLLRAHRLGDPRRARDRPRARRLRAAGAAVRRRDRRRGGGRDRPGRTTGSPQLARPAR